MRDWFEIFAMICGSICVGMLFWLLLVITP
jgi:hypothetical protein